MSKKSIRGSAKACTVEQQRGDFKKILDGETVNEMIAKAAETQIQRPSVI